MFKRNKEKVTYHLKAVIEEENRKKLQHTLIAYRRMVFMIGLIIVCMVILFGRVYYLTIHQHNYYTSKLMIYQTNTFSSSVPRGSIYDRKGRELVSTKSAIALMYYPSKGVSNDEEKAMAIQLVDSININIEHLSLRDKKDYYIMYNPKGAEQVITDDEWNDYRAERLNDDQIYNLKLERITEEMINNFWDERSLKAIHIYFLMNKNNNSPNSIIEGITEQEASFIAEHNDIFKGFYIDYSYERVYQFGNAFKQVFGKVSNTTQGLPVEESDYFLALGYQMTSSVGTSGLEKQYEDLLSGSLNEYNIDYDANGNAFKTDVTNGQKGYNLTLTIDWDMQEFLNQRIQEYLRRTVWMPKNDYFDRIFITMMDPLSGEILAMAGQIYNKKDGSFTDYSSGNYLEAYEPGSSVKGATLFSGYKYGVLSPGEYMMDVPIKIKDTPQKASWRSYGYINDLDAIAYSSNVYMMHIVIRIGGGHYVENQPLSVSLDTFQKMREAFGELGLGVLTGLDVPDEALGKKGNELTSGFLLDYAIGQYDNYTTIQLAQYISTIANGGKRIQPHLMKNAWYNDNGEQIIVYENGTNVLDDLSGSYSSYFARIRQAMVGTVNYGTVHGAIAADLRVGGKTGTAEVIRDGKPRDNRAFVGFAPYENPRIAYACMAPNQEDCENVSVCINLADEAMRYYKENYGY